MSQTTKPNSELTDEKLNHHTTDEVYMEFAEVYTQLIYDLFVISNSD